MLLTQSPVITPDEVLRLPQVSGGSRWWLLWTEPRKEKRLESSLIEAEAVPVRVTNVHIVTRFNGAGREFRERREVSLFPGYIFGNGTAEQIYDAKRAGGAQVVSIVNQAKAAEQIARTIELAASENNLTAVKIEVGKAVEIIRGPYVGKRGIVRENKQGVVYFDIETLGQSVPIQIASDCVEPV